MKIGDVYKEKAPSLNIVNYDVCTLMLKLKNTTDLCFYLTAILLHCVLADLVGCHLLRGRGGLLQHPELGLGLVLEVLAVAEDLARLHQGDRLPQTLKLPVLGLLHPGLKHLGVMVNV